MWTQQDANNRFSSAVDGAVAGQPQEVIRRGGATGVVLFAEAYPRLVAEAAGHSENLAKHLLAVPGDALDRLSARGASVVTANVADFCATVTALENPF